MKEKEKMTVPIPSVGADGEQSLSYVTEEFEANASHVGAVLSSHNDHEPDL